MNLKLFTIDAIGKVIQAGGKTVSKEIFQKRLEICQKCPHAGIVEPLPSLKIEGCKLCGCPFRTKLKTLTHFDINQKKIVHTECSEIKLGDGQDRWSNIKK